MKKSERAIVFPVTIGGLLEWYEIFLYIYWLPIISKNFIDITSPIMELITFISVLLIGLVARPIGGLFFGYLGDRYGRKYSFLLSMVVISLPSIFTAFIPSFTTWTLFFVISMGVLKFIQGIPAGGEIPGVICFLSESATPGRERYLCSYTFVGPLIGQILSMGQCLLMEKFLSHEFLMQFGWRISFFIGGLLGFFGFFLRKKLAESKPFLQLKEKQEVLKNPIEHALKTHKAKIFLGFVISIFEVVGFFLLTLFLIENAEQFLGLSLTQILFINTLVLTLTAIIIPIIGKAGDKFRNKPLHLFSAIGVIVVSPFFYLAISNSSKYWSVSCLLIMMLLLCIQYALLPSLLADLYPTSVKFTCIGLGFNVCDSIVGGFSAFLGYRIIQVSGNQGSFILILMLSALIFIAAIPFVKIKRESEKI